MTDDKLWLKAEPAQKIKFDTARYCRANAGRMGQWIGRQDVAGLIGGEVEQLKEHLSDAEWRLSVALGQVETIQAELAALKDAAKPVVAYYQWLKITEEDEFEPDELIIGSSLCGVTLDQLVELERLCGEG